MGKTSVFSSCVRLSPRPGCCWKQGQFDEILPRGTLTRQRGHCVVVSTGSLRWHIPKRGDRGEENREDQQVILITTIARDAGKDCPAIAQHHSLFFITMVCLFDLAMWQPSISSNP